MPNFLPNWYSPSELLEKLLLLSLMNLKTSSGVGSIWISWQNVIRLWRRWMEEFVADWFNLKVVDVIDLIFSQRKPTPKRNINPSFCQYIRSYSRGFSILYSRRIWNSSQSCEISGLAFCILAHSFLLHVDTHTLLRLVQYTSPQREPEGCHMWWAHRWYRRCWRWMNMWKRSANRFSHISKVVKD